MVADRDCRINELNIGILKIVQLENELVRATILAGKGADIYEIIYKPMDMDFLSKGQNSLESYRDRDLSRERLTSYAEQSTGGWQDLLPNRGTYKNVEIELENGGISATVPWAHKIIQNSAEAVSVLCSVDLPEFPVHMEKIFTIKKDDPSLYIGIKVKNTGESEVKYAWVQHCAFGGDFLNEDVRVFLPGSTAFQPRKYRENREKPMSFCEEPVNSVTFVSGRKYDIRKVNSRSEEDECFFVLDGIESSKLSLYDSVRSIGISLEWDIGTFPFIRCYYSYVKSKYAIMLEPSNDKFSSLSDSLKHGTYSVLDAGKETSTDIICRIFREHP